MFSSRQRPGPRHQLVGGVLDRYPALAGIPYMSCDRMTVQVRCVERPFGWLDPIYDVLNIEVTSMPLMPISTKRQ